MNTGRPFQRSGVSWLYVLEIASKMSLVKPPGFQGSPAEVDPPLKPGFSISFLDTEDKEETLLETSQRSVTCHRMGRDLMTLSS